MNTNGILSFREAFTSSSSGGNGFNSIALTHPIIAPFWDNIDTNFGGQIHYRQEFDPTITDAVQLDISAKFPDVTGFFPTLVYVVTWETVEPSSSTFRGMVNTFQAVIASDGVNSFVRFNYGDLQWETGALIGISAGDTVNFIQDSSSLTASVLSLANSALVHRIDVDNVPCKFYGNIIYNVL